MKEEYQKQTPLSIAKAVQEREETIRGLEERIQILTSHCDHRHIFYLIFKISFIFFIIFIFVIYFDG